MFDDNLVNQASGSCLFNQNIRIFYVVSVCRSFTKAAQKLSITQSAVSQCIANLEKDLGFELFDRSVRPLGLTPEATILKEKLFEQIGEFSLVLDTIRNQNFIQMSIKIGVLESVAHCTASDLIKTCLAKGRYIELRTGTSRYLYQSLLKDKVDCIIATGDLFDAENLEREFLYSEPHVVMIPREYSNRHQNWTWNNLSLCGIPMIQYAKNTGSRQLGEQVLRHANLKLPQRFSVDSNQIVFNLVANEMGWCLTQAVPALMASELLDKIKLLPAPEPSVHRRVYIVWKKGTPDYFVNELKSIFHASFNEKVIPALQKIMPWTAEQIHFE